MMTFDSDFKKLTSQPPFPWQQRLYSEWFAKGLIPHACCIPTGLGKTSVIAIWLIAFASGAVVPRRLIYVVNRRTVVDQTTSEMEQYRQAIDEDPGLSHLKTVFGILPISTLRGAFADNGDWCEDPSRPAVICGTVDMIGSRLLFSGYGIGRAKRPLHAGFLGQDSLLIHDEAHLEPAFQSLVESIEREQHAREPAVAWPKFRVMELTATSKSESPFTLDEKDYANATVTLRMTAVKKLHLHELADTKKPQKELAQKALEFRDSGKAILIFASSVEAVLDIAATLDKARLPVKTLTGTMRGKERDGLVDEPTFRRFLPNSAENVTPGTVYLVCTSAGEVGVNISADHLICDLSTFDSMAQRLGRVNRFGKVNDCEVHVCFPSTWDDKHSLTEPRQRTLELLRLLNGNASPKALGDLPSESRTAAFAPEPAILPTTDMLLDAWALTTITGMLPGRPPVEPYLHGLSDQELPETHVAWREEVHDDDLSGSEFENTGRSEILAKYPLLPVELLREPSYRAIRHLELIGKRNPGHCAWIVNESGDVEEVVSLGFFTDKDSKDKISGKIILLDPHSGGLSTDGMLDGSSETATDVSQTADRCRIRNDESVPADLHEVHRVLISSTDEEDVVVAWRYFARRNTGELQAIHPVSLHVHVKDVEDRLKEMVARLSLSDSLQRCLETAARYHDQGKKRLVFQTMLGNRNAPNVWLAKSGRRSVTRLEEKYRHEFGSLHELPAASELNMTEEERELVLHLIAAHHGRARPHFPADEVFDPDSNPEADGRLAQSVPQRFGRLQRKYGRWGLSYLESILRAADWAASANPSPEQEAGT